MLATVAIFWMLLLCPTRLLPFLVPDISPDLYAAAAESCGDQGWTRFEGKRKVYDMFMVNTELDWLEIRLGTTYNAVDYFIVVEANRTFTGLDKPLYVKNNWSKLKRFHDKIIYHEVNFPADFNPKDAWETEAFIRHSMFEQVLQKQNGKRKPKQSDVVVVADVDEIPRPETFHTLRACDFPRRVTLRSRFYYYSFQFLHQGLDWQHPQATFYEGNDTIPPNDLRGGVGRDPFEVADVWNASWHCSSCFKTVQEFRIKMESFSHTEYNGEKYRDGDWIADHVRTGSDMWERDGEMYSRVEGNRDVPHYLDTHANKFGYMVNRDGQSAGFSDYP